MRQFIAVLCLAFASIFATGGPASSQQSAIAAQFADNSSARAASLSPDGNYVAYIRHTAADEQVVVIDLSSHQGRAVQRIVEPEGEYLWVEWKGNERLLIGVSLSHTIEGRAATGTRRVSADREVASASVIALNRQGGGFTQMFQEQLRSLRGSTFLLDDLPDDPTNVLLIADDSSGRGVWRANVNTGRAERLVRGEQRTDTFFADGTGQVVMRLDTLSDFSGYRIFRRAAGTEDWTLVLEARRAATNSPDFMPVAAGPGPNQVYVTARTEGQDLASLYLYDTATGGFGAPLATASRADAGVPILHPVSRQMMASCEFAQRYSCQSSEALVQRHLNAVDGFFRRSATVRVVDMSDDANKWLLEVSSPTESSGYYLFDRTAARVSPVARTYPGVDANVLSPVEVVSYAARDGTQLWAYVTARPGQSGPRPAVVLPHGGPEARDYYGFDPLAQFLAARGYVVIQPNFRGSGGFGRAFADAGRGQWGARMQDDVSDALRHFATTGVIDASRVCIVGASYGGYAALAGVALTPDQYRCAVSIAGVSDLPEIVYRSAPRGTATRAYWVRSIGDPGANREALDAVSPRHIAERIVAPVLLIHGEEDDVVEIRQSELMSQALGRRVRFVRLDGEGHFWDEWSAANRLSVLREVEGFLAEHNPPN